jgi:hypothetical protein
MLALEQADEQIATDRQQRQAQGQKRLQPAP